MRPPKQQRTPRTQTRHRSTDTCTQRTRNRRQGTDDAIHSVPCPLFPVSSKEARAMVELLERPTDVAVGGEAPTKSLIEAIHDTLQDALRADDRVIILGE